MGTPTRSAGSGRQDRTATRATPLHGEAARLAVALVFLLVVGTCLAQMPFGHLQFERGESVPPSGADAAAEYRLGINAFTRAQLGYFLASIEPFLALAEALPAGEHVTLRQEGQRGYIALTAYDGGDAPRYVLTLAAQEPTGISTRSGLEALWVLLAEQIASPADLGEAPSPAP